MNWPNHDAAWREWREAMAGSRMHHAWILSGKIGLGKHDFALAAARELVAEEGIPQPAGDHPDIIVLSNPPKDDKEEKKRDEGKPYETKRNISVAQVRAMQQRLNTRPTLGSRRAIIIDPADDMERGASNALLKSLEEPPRGTFFILVTHRAAGLLPTIRSRCRMVRFANLDDQAIGQHLAEEYAGSDPAKREMAVAMASGSLGAARSFIEQDMASIARAMRELVSKGDPGFATRGKLVEAIGARPDRERLRLVLELARATLAQSLADAEPAQRLAFADTHEELVRLSAQIATYNYDTGLLAGEIAGLLARAGNASEPAHG
jgi:DNA polymerase-3 subunit delta'